MSDILVRGEQTTNTYAYMHKGANFMLKQAKITDEGKLYLVVASLVYSAFAVESYFNHLGEIKFNDWRNTERRLSKLNKFEKLANLAEIKYDFDDRPYSTLRDLFRFRDSMAHGKTTRDLISMSIDSFDGCLPRIQVKGNWRDIATVEYAQQALDDTNDIITKLHRLSGLGEKPFRSLEMGVFGISS